MDLLTENHLSSLATTRQPDCVTLLMTARGAGAEADPIQWKNLLNEAEATLIARGARGPAAREFLRPARALLSDGDFWRGPAGGLAFFIAGGVARAFRLTVPVEPVAVVAPRFFLKPLLPLAEAGGRYFLLTLSQNQVRLIRGSASRAEEVTLKGVPSSLEEALRTHDRDEPLEFHTHPALGLGRRGAIFHGQGVGIDDAKDNLLRYFRAIDHGLHATLRGEKAPLILASVDYLWPLYREVNTYPRLLEQGIAGNAERLSVAELHERALEVVAPLLRAPREKAAGLYARLAGTGRTAADLAETVTACGQGRIETLFVAMDAERWGRVDVPGGPVTLDEGRSTEGEDLLNVAALDTLTHGGTVFAVPSAEVPGEGPLAAIYWLPHAGKKQAAAAP
jgi:hypothetical protein